MNKDGRTGDRRSPAPPPDDARFEDTSGSAAESREATLSVAAFREAVGAQEAVRREAARRLHGTVLSKLTACSLWLGSVEQALADLDPRVIRDERATRAMELLSRVRAELDQLRKSDVRRLEHMLYPGLIHLGLRAALESWREFDRRAVSCEFQFDESFAPGDGPTTDRRTIAVRLELYRLIEAVVDAWSAAGVASAVDAEAGRLASGHRLEEATADHVQLTVGLSSRPPAASPEDSAEPSSSASAEQHTIHLRITAAFPADMDHRHTVSWVEAVKLPRAAVDRFVRAGGHVRIVYRSEGTSDAPTASATPGIAADRARPWLLTAVIEGGFA